MSIESPRVLHGVRTDGLRFFPSHTEQGNLSLVSLAQVAGKEFFTCAQSPTSDGTPPLAAHVCESRGERDFGSRNVTAACKEPCLPTIGRRSPEADCWVARMCLHPLRKMAVKTLCTTAECHAMPWPCPTPTILAAHNEIPLICVDPGMLPTLQTIGNSPQPRRIRLSSQGAKSGYCTSA